MADAIANLTVRGGLARDSLRLGVLSSMSPEQRLGWLVGHLADVFVMLIAGHRPS